jgi:hypothetical protein
MKRDAAPVCLFTIYDSPRDYPQHIVVRSWSPGADGKLVPAHEVRTYDIGALGPRGAMSAARGYCRRMGLTYMPRRKNDDPVIAETWMGVPNWPEAESTVAAPDGGVRVFV